MSRLHTAALSSQCGKLGGERKVRRPGFLTPGDSARLISTRVPGSPASPRGMFRSTVLAL